MNYTKDYWTELKRSEIDDEPVLTAGVNAAWTITLNELNLKILKTILQTLRRLQEKHFIDISRQTEEQVIVLITNKVQSEDSNGIKTITELEVFIDKELKKIEDYLQNLAIPFTAPNANWSRTGLEFLDDICGILSENILDFHGIRFFMLFDEFENLREFQQVIINEWIKTSKNFVIKLTSKFEGQYTMMTNEVGQPLQAGQDYFSYELDYDLCDDKRLDTYQNLLWRISKKLLSIENFAETDVAKLLKTSKERELPQETIDEEIKNIRLSSGLEFNPEKITDYRNKLEIAAIFRLLRQRQKTDGRKSKKKIYDGFETYTYLSSGVIRIFLNLVGMAVYKAEDEGIDVRGGASIPSESQTWAANVISKAWLEKIPINLEEYGGDNVSIHCRYGRDFSRKVVIQLQ